MLRTIRLLAAVAIVAVQGRVPSQGRRKGRRRCWTVWQIVAIEDVGRKGGRRLRRIDEAIVAARRDLRRVARRLVNIGTRVAPGGIVWSTCSQEGRVNGEDSASRRS